MWMFSAHISICDQQSHKTVISFLHAIAMCLIIVSPNNSNKLVSLR